MKVKHLYKAFGDLNENEDFTIRVYLWAAQTLCSITFLFPPSQYNFHGIFCHSLIQLLLDEASDSNKKDQKQSCALPAC